MKFLIVYRKGRLCGPSHKIQDVVPKTILGAGCRKVGKGGVGFDFFTLILFVPISQDYKLKEELISAEWFHPGRDRWN